MAAEKKQGIVYCLTNPAMPELVKIGCTKRGDDTNALKSRMNELYTSGVPLPFELKYAVRVDAPSETERLLHDAFDGVRDNKRREFFTIDAERVVAAMKLTGGEEVVVDDESANGDSNSKIGKADIEARARARQRLDKRLSNFKFSDANIPPEAELSFIDDGSIKVTVIGGNKVKFGENETTLTGAAKIVLGKVGQSGSIAGPQYWMYEGETVSRRRARLEKETEEES